MANPFDGKKGIKFAHINCRSIYNKLAQIQLLFGNYDFLLCSETWLSTNYSDSLLDIPGIKIFRLDRSSRGGGICIYVKAALSPFCEINRRSTSSSPDIEILSLDVKKTGLKYMLISSVYRPPRGNVTNFVDRLTGIFNNKDNSKKEFWLLGDFNIDYLDRGNQKLLKLNNLFKKFGLSQLIKSITRPGNHKSSCIDWIVSNSNFISYAGVSDIMISDHYAVHCIKKKDRECVAYVYRTLRNYNMFNMNNFVDLLRLKLNDIHFFGCQDPNILWDHVYSMANEILSVMCPYRRYRHREKITPWMHAAIYREIRVRTEMVKIFNYTRTNYSLTRLRRQRNVVNSMIDTAKRDYVNRMLHQNSRNPKKFWRIINHMLKGFSNKVESIQLIDNNVNVPHGEEATFLNGYFCNISDRLGLSNDLVIEETINEDLNNMYGIIDNVFDLTEDEILAPELEIFVDNIDVSKSSGVKGISTSICKTIMKFFPEEISYIYRCSITTCVFPRDWSKGCITVIPKSGNLADPSNWRPITQTSIFAKIFEKLINRRVMSYFDDLGILSKYQYGFRSGRSTQQAVFDFTKFVYSGLNNKKIIATTCLDVCKAFDCINHTVLLHKFAYIGFAQTTIDWFKSYLTRTQTVRFNYQLSDELSIKTGIGQGTILGPLLFLYYINDIVLWAVA